MSEILLDHQPPLPLFSPTAMAPAIGASFQSPTIGLTVLSSGVSLSVVSSSFDSSPNASEKIIWLLRSYTLM